MSAFAACIGQASQPLTLEVRDYFMLPQAETLTLDTQTQGELSRVELSTAGARGRTGGGCS